MTNAYQMAILTQFNENDTQTYGDISASTRISDEALKPQVGLLVKARVLLQDGDTYDLNLSPSSNSTLSMMLIPWYIQISSRRRCAEETTSMEALLIVLAADPSQPQSPGPKRAEGRNGRSAAICGRGPEIRVSGDDCPANEGAQGERPSSLWHHGNLHIDCIGNSK